MNRPPAPPGWYLDPSDSSRERWWDGAAWGDQSRPFGAAPAPAAVAAAAPAHPPGWYPDAEGDIRYWNGEAWTQDVALARPRAVRPPAFWCAIAGAALMVLGGLGPWATALRLVDVSGTKGDGWLVISAAIVAAGVLFASPRDAGPVVALLAAIGGAIVGVVDLNDINSRSALVTPGWGIYMVILSSGALFVSSLVLLVQRRS